MKVKTSTYNKLQPLCWTEDNRLQAVKDNKMGAYYNYDAQGERNLKLTGGTINITQNGQNIYVPVLDQQTLYASALVTVNDKGYTKHYFEEGKRICSKIGSGELRNVDDWIGHMGMNYEEQRSIQFDGVTKTYEQCMNITPHVKNRNLYKDIIKKYQNKINSSEPSFYYHSDHLGSASFLTDETGAETQQLVYLPFGEDWVDMKYNTSQYETPYKFNGKEKDQETGYNYFGARYLNPTLSIWLSVDPLSDKYPHLTSYNYCANNPVMLIDPDGRKIVIAGEDGTSVEYTPNMKSDDKRVQMLNKTYKTKEGKSVIDNVVKSEKVFNINEQGIDGAEGSVIPSMGEYDVSWSNPNESHGGDAEDVFNEELFHCNQIANNQWDFDGDGKGNISLEVQAKEFSVRMNEASGRGFSSYYYENNHYKPTEMNVMQGRDRWNSPDKASYLKGNAQVGWFKSFPNGADRPDRYQKSPKSY